MATAESRHVMKALASFGPGGSVGIFVEKLCHVFFKEAYEMEDPAQQGVKKEDENLTEARKAFVELLFDKKGEWGRAIEKGGEQADEAY